MTTMIPTPLLLPILPSLPLLRPWVRFVRNFAKLSGFSAISPSNVGRCEISCSTVVTRNQTTTNRTHLRGRDKLQ